MLQFGNPHGSILFRPSKRIPTRRLGSPIRLQIMPEQPQKRGRPTLTRKTRLVEEIVEFARRGEVQFRHLLAVRAKEEDEGDGRGEGDDSPFSAFEELFPGKGFVAVFLDALEDGFDARRVLEEFCVLFLAGLEGGDWVVCP